MNGLLQAIITPDKKVKCPICGKTAMILNDDTFIRNCQIRCRASRKGLEHYFMLNAGEMEVLKNVWFINNHFINIASYS